LGGAKSLRPSYPYGFSAPMAAAENIPDKERWRIITPSVIKTRLSPPYI
jgi:hypothetical protein